MLEDHPPSETSEVVPDQPDMKEEVNQNVEDRETTFEFPISNNDEPAAMKNISPSALPNFHGSITEDPNTF
ncbi:hypothetical protein KI387_038449, partial [Taxus chinensis]